MTLDEAFTIAQWIVRHARAPVSIYVSDDHGEVVLAATMDGASPDTRLNAQRKAYTSSRSDTFSTGELAAKIRDDPVELASFDPHFTFFKGGVAAFRDGKRIGAVGVSGLAGDEDEALARGAIEAVGLQTQTE